MTLSYSEVAYLFYFPTANGRSLSEEAADTDNNKTPPKEQKDALVDENMQDSTQTPELSERRKALFEPLEPARGQRQSAESLLPPPDFDSASYPKGWLIGKKRKLVNVDVVESMRRIAVQEMNRKVAKLLQSYLSCFALMIYSINFCIALLLWSSLAF